MVAPPKKKSPEKKLFVEGGGDNDALKTQCRRGFGKLLEKVGLQGRKPRIVPCGGRNNAFDQFCTALARARPDDVFILLVDAEAPISTGTSPWDHVKNRPGDGWEKPKDATEDHLHLMVECMENWFLADKDALASFFGPGFKQSALPANANVESVSKSDVYRGLKSATRGTTTGEYGKGAHSFKILAMVDPGKIRSSAQYAERFFQYLVSTL